LHNGFEVDDPASLSSFLYSISPAIRPPPFSIAGASGPALVFDEIARRGESYFFPFFSSLSSLGSHRTRSGNYQGGVLSSCSREIFFSLFSRRLAWKEKLEGLASFFPIFARDESGFKHCFSPFLFPLSLLPSRSRKKNRSYLAFVFGFFPFPFAVKREALPPSSNFFFLPFFSSFPSISRGGLRRGCFFFFSPANMG